MARLRPRLPVARRRAWEDKITRRLEAIERATEEYYKEIYRATEDGMTLADIGYTVGISPSSIGAYRDKGETLTNGASKS